MKNIYYVFGNLCKQADGDNQNSRGILDIFPRSPRMGGDVLPLAVASAAAAAVWACHAALSEPESEPEPQPEPEPEPEPEPLQAASASIVPSACPALPSDPELLRVLAAEIKLDGGVTELSALPGYTPSIRKLLGPRKLARFVEAHPMTFRLTDEERKGRRLQKVTLLAEPPAAAAAAGSVACVHCPETFRSRNTLFKHLHKPGACPGGAPAEGRQLAQQPRLPSSAAALVDVVREILAGCR